MTEQRSKIYTKAVELSDMMGLSAAEEANLQSILDIFPMAIPQYYLSLIDWNDPDDPIRRMCIPSLTEIDISGDFDTSGEADNTVVTGLQHKYQQTALILSTNRCAMYCRHCFRKRLVGSSEEEIADNFDAMLDYIKAHPEITNILVSGGDSLMLSNATLEKYLCELTALPQLDFIRFGSRVPVVYPERILRDEELQAIFAKYAERKQLYLVTQFNHPRELTAEAKAVIKIFIKAGVVLRNQTVLLRGVNDDPQVLGQLLRELTAVGVSPYYAGRCAELKRSFRCLCKRAWRLWSWPRGCKMALANVCAIVCPLRGARWRLWANCRITGCCLSITKLRMAATLAVFLWQRCSQTNAGWS